MMVDRYTTKPHSDCRGKGCEGCDWTGREVERRRSDAEMMQLHMDRAESLYRQAEGDGDSAHWRGRGDWHMQVAAQYAAIVQAEAMRTIASVLEAMPDELTESVRVWGVG